MSHVCMITDCPAPGCPYCNYAQPMMSIQTLYPTRVMPVNIPFPDYGLTIATLDQWGNVTVKINQPGVHTHLP